MFLRLVLRKTRWHIGRSCI